MNTGRFIRNNLIYYWKKHILLALGVAISGAVITGALLVGDSVQYSLKRIVEQRLGEVSHVMKAGDRYFTTRLTERVAENLQAPVSSLLLQEGTAVADGGQLRVNKVQVLGVDENFDSVAGLNGFFSELSGDTIIISRNLANRLNKSVGDDLLLRIEKASLIPLNAPFVSDAELMISLRAVIRDIVDEEKMGRFNLGVSQTAPFNVFMDGPRLQELMDFQGRVNVMLVAENSGRSSAEILDVVNQFFSAADAGLKITELEESQELQITSDRVFIDESLSEPLLSGGARDGTGSGEGIISYFVNEFQAGDRKTPYSFVSTLPASRLKDNEIIINSWLADDLKLGPGDTLQMTWFEVGSLRELNEVSSAFVIKAIVAMEGRYADASVMPDLPGLSDAGNCRDWDTGVPISLESIRDKDEDYWDEYGGLPKAYISIGRAVEMWKNRFGVYTSIRYDMASHGLEASVMKGIKPSMLGFTVEATRLKGDEAAGEGVDFSQLFAGLSFFLLLAGVILTIMLFLLNIESREQQVKTLFTLGIPSRLIRRIMFFESMVVALVGAAGGLGLAVLYNRLVFNALNGIWKDVVRTEMMHVQVTFSTLLLGMLITLFFAFLSFWFPLNKKLKRLASAHTKPVHPKGGRHGIRKVRLALIVALVSGISASVIMLSQFASHELVNAALFFPAGGLLLISALAFFYWYLGKREQPSTSTFDLSVLSWKNATRMRTRSMSIVILFAIGAFLVISTGSNRKDLFANSEDPSSGTGGFLFFAQSTMPVLQNLNDPAVKYEYGLLEELSFVQMRQADGDDASCLNLNKIVNPKVLGLEPSSLEGSFSFVTRTPLLDEDDPWSSLEQVLPGGLIPAIADETVIKYGLGLSVGDTLRYTNSNGGTMELLLVGGMASSVFQGSVIISNANFLEQFPESSGSRVFLVDGALADTAQISEELLRGMRDLGWDMQLCSLRLAEFNSVTNAYLSIFMVLGALGLLLGTFGLVVVLSRSILERKQEIALLKAVGYGRKEIRKLITREYFFLLFWGIFSGFVSAIIATLPSILSSHSGTSFSSILIWLLVLVLNGWIWIRVVTAISLNNPHIYEGLRNE
ncbi:MAG: FtsX-like permease family protein [Bacteroides sp.]|nr:FtsX-like permease family protein [Bacteroides sp.]